MTPDTIQATAVAFWVQQPIRLIGKPGIGKTQIARAICQALGLHCETVILSLRDPSDVGGLPIVVDGQVVLAPPKWARDIVALWEQKKTRSVLLFDEFGTAKVSVHAAAMRVINEGWVGDLKLPDVTSYCATDNPPDCGVGTIELAAPVANRMTHLAWHEDAEVWATHMRGESSGIKIKRPTLTWEQQIPEAQKLVGRFVEKNPKLLHQLPKEGSSEAGMAWASPRTWKMAARLYAACTSNPEIPEAVLQSLLYGTVGVGPATEFLGWLREGDLPDATEVLEKPEILDNLSSDRIARVLGTLVDYTLRQMAGDRAEETWNKAWGAFSHLAQTSHADVAVRHLIPMTRAPEVKVSGRFRFQIPAASLDLLKPALSAAGVMPK